MIFMYFVFTRTPGESYCRRLRSLFFVIVLRFVATKNKIVAGPANDIYVLCIYTNAR